MEHAMRMEQLRARVAAALDSYVPASEDASGLLCEAMRYSLLPPGKCVRPILLLAFNQICGGDEAAALPFACALEMLHTYSLIHDDLPCMDNDDFRRGRPSNHKVYGEDMALLAGSSLLSLVFETVLARDAAPGLPPERVLRAAYVLAEASGARGMAGGQAMDIRAAADSDLTLLYERKTGALFRAAAEAGCILAGADEARIAAAGRFGLAVGLAFQLADDLLDGGGTYTPLSLYGEAWCRAKIQALNAEALTELKAFDDPPFLIWMIQDLAARQQ